MSDDDKLVLTVGGVLLVVIGIVVLLVTYRSHTNAQVTQLTWQRKIDIQQYMTVQESDWSVPQGGRETRHYEDIHHWDRYVSGSHQVCTMSTTNGRVSQSCHTELEYSSRPVYETKYDYDIDRWITVRTPERHGVGTDAAWPDVTDLKECATLGCERAGTRYSTYTVHFTQNYTLDMTEERWRSYNPGQHVTLILNIFNQPLDVERPT